MIPITSIILFVTFRNFQFLTSSFVPFISIIAVYIAYQQYYMNKLQVKLHIYDKRYEVYEKVREFIASVCQCSVSNEEALEFYRGTRQALFLYGQEIDSYILKLYNNNKDLNYYDNKINDDVLGESELEKLVNKRMKLHDWFANQLFESKIIFGKFLDLEQIR